MLTFGCVEMEKRLGGWQVFGQCCEIATVALLGLLLEGWVKRTSWHRGLCGECLEIAVASFDIGCGDGFDGFVCGGCGG